VKHDGKWPFQEAQAKIAKAQQHDERKKGKSPGFFTMIWNALTFTSDSITGVATSGTSIGRGVCGLHNLGMNFSRSLSISLSLYRSLAPCPLTTFLLLPQATLAFSTLRCNA